MLFCINHLMNHLLTLAPAAAVRGQQAVHRQLRVQPSHERVC